MPWLLHRSPWKPVPAMDIPNGTEDLPNSFEDLLNDTRQQHLIFKLMPKKVFDGGTSTSKYRRSRRQAQHVRNDYRSSSNGRRKRDVTVRMPERTVETLVVIDRMMLEYHKTKQLLEPYVLTIMNIVSTSKFITIFS